MSLAASAVSDATAACRTRNSSTGDGGNFGAVPNPPSSGSSERARTRTASESRSASTGSGGTGQPDGSRKLGFGHPPRQGLGVLLDALAPFQPGIADRLEHLAERGPAGHGPGREVGAGMEGASVRREEDGHRPAAFAADGLGCGHVDGVHVRTLFPVHLDGHEVGVEEVRCFLVLEGLVRHDMAPVARRVADGQEHGDVALGGEAERLIAEGPPVDRVVGVLPQVGGRFPAQGIGGPGPDCAGSPSGRLRR